MYIRSLFHSKLASLLIGNMVTCTSSGRDPLPLLLLQMGLLGSGKPSEEQDKTGAGLPSSAITDRKLLVVNAPVPSSSLLIVIVSMGVSK